MLLTISTRDAATYMDRKDLLYLAACAFDEYNQVTDGIDPNDASESMIVLSSKNRLFKTLVELNVSVEEAINTWKSL